MGLPRCRGADTTVEGAVESAGGVDALAVPAPASTAAAMASVPMDRRQWRIFPFSFPGKSLSGVVFVNASDGSL